ncbi:unnamed protein product [Arctogadus glacialis]
MMRAAAAAIKQQQLQPSRQRQPHSTNPWLDMGQSRSRPRRPAPATAPSPRAVGAQCPAEAPHRVVCHHHLQQQQKRLGCPALRPTTCSPPYSPSVFRRPDRRAVRLRCEAAPPGPGFLPLIAPVA